MTISAVAHDVSRNRRERLVDSSTLPLLDNSWDAAADRESPTSNDTFRRKSTTDRLSVRSRASSGGRLAAAEAEALEDDEDEWGEGAADGPGGRNALAQMERAHRAMEAVVQRRAQQQQ